MSYDRAARMAVAAMAFAGDTVQVQTAADLGACDRKYLGCQRKRSGCVP